MSRQAREGRAAEKRFVRVAARSEVPVGGMKAVEAGGAALLVCNVGGRLYAVRDECTHEGFPLSEGSVEGETVVCRLHGARFDLRSGEVLAPPAYEPLETYEVRVDGDDVWVAVESRGSEG